MSNPVKQELIKIEIPNELSERSKSGIKTASNEMKRRGKMYKILKPLGSVAAAAVLLVSLTLLVNPSFASSIQGFFKDITNWKGTVVGLEYNQATEEIHVNIAEPILKDNKYVLPIEVTFNNAEKPPFVIADALTIGKFEIYSQSGVEIPNEQIQVQPIEKEHFTFEIKDGDKLLTEVEDNHPLKRTFEGYIIIDKELFNLNDTYILSIDSFVQHGKGDAPLTMNGKWKIEFLIK